MEHSRDALRILRYLSRGRARAEACAREDRVTLSVRDRPAIVAKCTDIGNLVRAGLVVRHGECMALSETGRARCRRLADKDDPYAGQHRDVTAEAIRTGDTVEHVARNSCESPLAALARRKDRKGRPFLTSGESAAGERLRVDYTRGQIMPRMGANWQAAVASGARDGGRGGMADLTDAALAARQRVDRALIGVGPELAGVLVDICCFLKGLETVEMERGWPVRSAKIVLKTALGCLERHYDPQSRERRRGALLHWGAEGYKPKTI